MKINNITMAIIAAASLLAVTPAVRAQTNNAGGAAAPARPRGGAMTVESIDKAVTLTEDQKPKVKAALGDLNSAIQEARNADQSERRTKMTAARDDFNTKMKGILTPEQYTKFEAMPRGGRRGQGGGGAGGGGGNPPPAN